MFSFVFFCFVYALFLRHIGICLRQILICLQHILVCLRLMYDDYRKISGNILHIKEPILPVHLNSPAAFTLHIKVSFLYCRRGQYVVLLIKLAVEKTLGAHQLDHIDDRFFV